MEEDLGEGEKDTKQYLAAFFSECLMYQKQRYDCKIRKRRSRAKLRNYEFDDVKKCEIRPESDMKGKGRPSIAEQIMKGKIEESWDGTIDSDIDVDLIDSMVHGLDDKYADMTDTDLKDELKKKEKRIQELVLTHMQQEFNVHKKDTI